MKTHKMQSLLPALLCGAALLAFGCKSGEVDQAGQLPNDREESAQVAQTPASELQPEPQSVEVDELNPADLNDRERELAEREAELKAREARLREFEAPAPAPAEVRPETPAVRQETQVARQEPPRQPERIPTPTVRREKPKPTVPREKPRPAPAPAPQPTQPEERRAEPAPAPVPEPAEEPRREEPAREETVEQPRTTTVTLPAGTVIDVEFTDDLASNTASAGDTFRVRVSHDVEEDGLVAIPAGSEILGQVTEAVATRKVGGRARLALRFTDLVLPSGRTVPIDASFVQQGRNETGKDAATIGGGAAAGAVLGRILNKGSRSRGSIIGAVIGAAAGTAIASRSPGEEVVIVEGSIVSLKLDGSLEVRARR